MGTFFYGLNPDSKSKDLGCQIFPYLMSKIDNRFCMENCSFTVSPSKLSTARSVIGK